MLKRKILIVDDENFVRSALKKELEGDNNFHVELAANGQEALEKAEKERFDLFFIDLVMPEMDGVTTCKFLKKLSPTSEFVCFTGIFDRVLSKRGTDYIDADGKTRLLYKPFREKAFIDTAQAILGAAK